MGEYRCLHPEVTTRILSAFVPLRNPVECALWVSSPLVTLRCARDGCFQDLLLVPLAASSTLGVRGCRFPLGACKHRAACGERLWAVLSGSHPGHTLGMNTCVGGMHTQGNTGVGDTHSGSHTCRGGYTCQGDTHPGAHTCQGDTHPGSHRCQGYTPRVT